MLTAQFLEKSPKECADSGTGERSSSSQRSGWFWQRESQLVRAILDSDADAHSSSVHTVLLRRHLRPATDPAPLAVEVVSVKPNKSATGVTMGIPGGRVRLIGITVRQLLVRAYRVQPFEIIGGPNWISTDRFDVIAKASEAATLVEINSILRALIAERFGLVARVKQRESRRFFS